MESSGKPVVVDTQLANVTYLKLRTTLLVSVCRLHTQRHALVVRRTSVMAT